MLEIRKFTESESGYCLQEIFWNWRNSRIMIFRWEKKPKLKLNIQKIQLCKQLNKKKEDYNMSKKKDEIYLVVQDSDGFHFEKDGQKITDQDSSSSHNNFGEVKNDKHVLIAAGSR